MSSEDVYNWTVYGIVCPLTGDVRYIGVTCDLAARRRDHRRLARKGSKGRLYDWLRAMDSEGALAAFVILEKGNGYQAASESEKRWIEIHRSNGRLLNVRPGGEFMDSLDAYKATRNAAARAMAAVAGKRNAVQQARRAVVCLTTGEKFQSVSDCSRRLGVPESRIYQSCARGYRCLGRALAYADDTRGGEKALSRNGYKARAETPDPVANA
jgi:hypothetical protein